MLNMISLSISLKDIGETLLMLLIGGIVIVIGIKIAINLAKKAIGFIAVAVVIGMCVFGYTVIFPSNSEDTEYVETDETYEEDNYSEEEIPEDEGIDSVLEE